jgi:hypothetical protein
VVGKVLSLFEAHTQVIRKGKPDKPTELGRLVRIDEVEHGIVSGYKVQEGNPADTHAGTLALQQHQALFGQAPRLATADRGYFSGEGAGSAGARGGEGGPAGARASVAHSRPAAEAALVPTGAALASRQRSHDQHLEASLLDGARDLPRRVGIPALCGVEHHYEESVFHRPLASAKERPCPAALTPGGGGSCCARWSV